MDDLVEAGGACLGCLLYLFIYLGVLALITAFIVWVAVNVLQNMNVL